MRKRSGESRVSEEAADRAETVGEIFVMTDTEERFGWYWWRATPDSLWEVVLCGGSSFIRVGDNAAWTITNGEWGERITAPRSE